MATPAIRVMCVEDHRIVREGLALIINQEPDMKIVGSCATVNEAIELYRTVHPDVTLMDLRLGTGSGVDAIKAIRADNAEARIIVLTMYEGDEDIFRAHQAGATTYLLKDTLSTDLVRVVREYTPDCGRYCPRCRRGWLNGPRCRPSRRGRSR